MGARNACAWVCGAHSQILLHANSITPDSFVYARKPFPRTPLVHALVVGDHIWLYRDSPQDHSCRQQAYQSRKQGRQGYDAVDLKYSEKKARMNQSKGVGIGAECLGNDRLMAAERGRRLGLSMLSL